MPPPNIPSLNNTMMPIYLTHETEVKESTIMIIGLVYYTVWSVLILSGTFSDGTFGDWDV